MGEECNIGLGLGVGSHENYSKNHDHSYKKSHVQFHILFPPRPNYKEEEQQGGKRSASMDRDEEDEEQAVIKDQKGGSTRKKLRLTEGQSTLLEDTFRRHHALNLIQKQELADKLNLKPRQVEVWFQNRRARNKLKQTEMDREQLKKWCEGLSSENRRLRRELEELQQSMKNIGGTAAMLTRCPSCERIATADSGRRDGVGDSSLTC